MLIVRLFFLAGNGNKNFTKYGSSSIIYLCLCSGLFAVVVGNIETRKLDSLARNMRILKQILYILSLQVLLYCRNLIILLEVLT